MSERMKFRHVKPADIHVPEVRVTSIWSDEEYGDFEASLGREGIKQPLKCILDEGKFWLVDGLHRLDEAKRLDMDKVPVVYKEGALVDALVENLTSNRLRGKTPVTDEVKLLRHLRDEYQMEPWKISEITGLSRERVEMRLAIGSAAPEVLSCLEFEQISLGVAFQLSRLPNEGGQIALLARLLQTTPPATVKEVTGIIDHALEIQAKMVKGPVHSEPVIPTRTIGCHLCGEKYHVSDMRGINVCATCHGLARDYIQQLKKRRKEEISPEDALAREVAGEQNIDEARAHLEAVREARE